MNIEPFGAYVFPASYDDFIKLIFLHPGMIPMFSSTFSFPTEG